MELLGLAGGLDRASHGLAVTDQLIEIRCAPVDLGDTPSRVGAQRAATSTWRRK